MKKQTILFLDNTYPKSYQISTLTNQAIGGTEASIIKTAIILTKEYNVVVAQKYREHAHIENDSLKFIPKTDIYKLKPEFIIVLRKYPLLKELHNKFPTAKLFLWIHTYKNYEYVFKKFGLSHNNTTIICNSNTHKKDTERLLNKTIIAKLFSLFTKKTQVEYCYNPISKPQQTDGKRDTNKLLFFSSPNKGLKQIIKCFNHINQELPDLKLYIANPGYKDNDDIYDNYNIIILGSLPHKQMMQHVSQSLCVFYPQDSFAETFGLIYAEANSYGTTVLAHDIGSAREILHKNNQIIDAENYQGIIESIKSLQSKYPIIEYNNKFSDKSILTSWKKLF